MAKPIRFAPQKTTSGSWRLNIPAKYSESGKRERHFYSTRDKALEAAAKLKAGREIFGTQAMAIPPTLAEAATAAVKLLEPLGIGLLEAVQRYVEQENKNRASVTAKQAVAAFRGVDDLSDKTAAKAKQAKAKRKEWSTSQATAYKLRGEKLVEAFGERMISTITGEELREHLESTTGGPGSFNQALRLTRAIWNWCAKPPRKWCETEAVEHLEAQDAVSGEIGVLSHHQALALMRAAETHLPETVPAFAIALFTGMRQAEIERLTPGDITAEGINVPAINDRKNKRRRFIQMPEPLAAWLKRYPVGESVTPPDWPRRQVAVRRLAGFKVWSDFIPRLGLKPTKADKFDATPPDSLPEWPDNALRHTAATVAVAMGKPIETLIFEHGHSGGVTMLKRHYVGALPKAEALKIWGISPTPKRARKNAVEAPKTHLKIA